MIVDLNEQELAIIDMALKDLQSDIKDNPKEYNRGRLEQVIVLRERLTMEIITGDSACETDA